MAASEALTPGSTPNGKLRDRLRTLAATSPFIQSLTKGLVGGGIVLLLLVGWMALRQDGTAQKMQDYIPAKSTAIEQLTPNSPDRNAGKTETPEADTPKPKRTGALTEAPIAGLAQDYQGKLLPISRIEDDMTPFQAYKKPVTLDRNKAHVSIVLVDFGLSESLSRSALENLNDNISFVLNPYSSNPDKWGKDARAYGHEFWLSLPMQTKNFTSDDPGPATLMMQAGQKENESRLFSILSLTAGYTGIVSQQDHAFTGASVDPGPVMKQIFGRGLAFAESNPDVPAYGLSIAMEFGYPYVQNNYWLDADLRPEGIDAALRTLEQQAQRKGKAIAFMRPYPMVVNKVQAWIETANDKGLQLVPLSATVQ